MDTAFEVTIGAEYAVYGVTVWRGHCWYYVFDDDDLAYPVWKPAALFEVSDPTMPRNWVFGYVQPVDGDGGQGFPVISFPEWALDRYFYEHLVDGDRLARAAFDRNRAEAERVTSK